MTEEKNQKSKRGFASMDVEKRREIARKGGRAVAKENRSFSRNKSLAQMAGRKGGSVRPSDKNGLAVD